MEEVLLFIQQNVHIAPFIIFGLLLLAGLNIPVSEDAMLFISGVLASQHEEYFWQLFFGVYIGAFCSDLIAYGVGRYFGPKIFHNKFISKFVSEEKVVNMIRYYTKYGFVTLFIGRFIPFGVRNVLFISAGLSKMNFKKFALTDLVAATLSCSMFFMLYYTFGEAVIEYVKKGNMILISIFILVIAALIINNRRTKKLK